MLHCRSYENFVFVSFFPRSIEFRFDLDLQFSHPIDPRQFSKYVTDVKVGRALSKHVGDIKRNQETMNLTHSTFQLQLVGKTTVVFHDFKKTSYSDCSEKLTDQEWVLTCTPRTDLGDTKDLIRSGKTVLSCQSEAGAFSKCHVAIRMRLEAIDFVVYSRNVRQMSLAAAKEASEKYFGIATLLEKPTIGLTNVSSFVRKTTIGDFVELAERYWKDGGMRAIPKGSYQITVPGLYTPLQIQAL